MDRNSIIGLLLIGAILVVFSLMNQPGPEELEALRRKQDSIAAVQEAESRAQEAMKKAPAAQDTAVALSDSASRQLMADSLGIFAEAGRGKEELFTLENELIRVTLSTLGGRVVSAELKGYFTYDTLPLILFDREHSAFGLNFFERNNRLISTNDLYFEPEGKSFAVAGKKNKSFSMKLRAGSGRYIGYRYSLSGNSHLLDVEVVFEGLGDDIAANVSSLDLHWAIRSPRQEKSLENERLNTTVYFRYFDDEVDYITESSDERKDLEARVQWVGFKQQFFNATLIAAGGFDKPISVETKTDESSDRFTRTLSAGLSLPFQHGPSESFAMQFYFGPNHYRTLKDLGMDMEDMIPLGWGIFGWVNRFCVIPVFNFLDGFDISYGIIILLLTILIKVALFPLTYKTYLSGAKMRLLKPEIDELNKKFSKREDMMKKQQATMSLYKQAGVNPLGGCVPMLLQMPILYAMFRFFPSSIELRQESFLWATDLSTYDSVLELSFTIPFYGNHVSLFTLLMTASIYLTMKYNTGQYGGNEQMAKQMKIMMYIMPVTFMFFLNNFSSGLTYYYFAANMITFAQQFAIKKWFIDEEAIRRQIQENKKRPERATKSRFQRRLEEMAKQRGVKLPKK